MAMNPRAGRGRQAAHRGGPGPRPPSSTDPRRRPPRARDRPDRSPPPASTASALDAAIDDLTESWGRGDRPRAEAYAGAVAFEDYAELIYHEYCLAEASDLAPDPADFLRRFPDHADRLARLFALHGAIPGSTLRDWAEPAEFPEAGDEIGPYGLVRELGRGAFARVFLAEQADLDRRLVVLKVSARSTAEPRLLARARHPHIVEVLRHASTADGGLHLVCMPFLGGATLASVLDARRAIGRPARSGRDFLADLDRVSAPEYPRAQRAGPAREILQGLSHAQGLAWVVARLAEALDHAYARGVAHGDLKPSNVLITAEAAPLLLDMNLSTEGHDGGDEPSADLGGTMAYMAPERLSAIARGWGEPPSGPLDRHRADLYALGLVLLEALTGEPPEVPRARPRDARALAATLAESRRARPELASRPIPPALRSILARCLDPDPARRYARGNELAEDLDLWRSDRPLARAEETRRSALARSARRRRFPLIAVAMTLVAALAVSGVASRLMTGSRRDVALALYRSLVGRPDSGAFNYRQVSLWRDDDSSDPAEASARQLARYDALDNPAWRDRDDVRSLPDRERGELEAWLLEQVLRHAVALRLRTNSRVDWKRALDLLERTVARASSTVLLAERGNLLRCLDLPEAAAPASPSSVPRWMDDYLAGVAAEPLHAREALDLYLEALRGRPDLLWARYRASVAACRIGEYGLAAEQLRRCIDRYPENPALRLLLASSLCNAERESARPTVGLPYAAALAECDRAVALDPDYARSYRIRALIRHAAGRDDEAKADLKRHTLLMTRSGPGSAAWIGFALDCQAGSIDAMPREALQILARKILDDAPRDHGARTNLAAMLSQAGRAAEAVAEFDRVLESDPGHLLARYQRALLIHRNAPAHALAEYSALIEHPRFEELFAEQPGAIRAFHHVATDHLKQGRLSEALEVARRALAHVNRSRVLKDEATLARPKAGGPVGFSAAGETYYLIARIHAAEAAADRGRIGQVADCLDRAFATSREARDWFPEDSRFDGLRDELRRRLKPVATAR